MESIKTLALRLLKFLKLHNTPSHTAIDQSLPSEEPRATEPTAPLPLDGLNLSPRVFNCLWNSGIRTIEAVDSMPDESLLGIRGFGAKALTELNERLASYNISNDVDRPKRN